MSKAPLINASHSVETVIALSGASSESTVDSQLTKAISQLQAYTSADSNESSAVTSAIAALQARQAHVRSPFNKGG